MSVGYPTLRHLRHVHKLPENLCRYPLEADPCPA